MKPHRLLVQPVLGDTFRRGAAWLSRLSRHAQQAFGPQAGNPRALAFGALAACGGLLLWLFSGLKATPPLQIYHHEGHLDFKNASILGNPSRMVLREEEARLSKTQKTVLDSHSQLQKEVEELKAQFAALTLAPTATPTAVASVALVEQARDANTPSAGLVAALPPATVQARSLAAAGERDEFSHTEVKPLTTQRSSAEKPFSSILGEPPTRQSGAQKTGASLISFPVHSAGKAYLKTPSIVLPAGSYVKATLLTGVEAPEGKTYPVLLQLDFAYVIPQDKRLDLTGCFIIAKATGDLSTERVQMQATKLSCVSKRNGMFEREVNGFIADDLDNSFSLMGSVNSKQDRVVAVAFLASIVEGITKAVQQAQVTQMATPLGGGQSVVTGDQAQYIGAGALAAPASMITQWYLKQAQNLLPTINVGSGQSVWIVMQDSVDLPKSFFNPQPGARHDLSSPHAVSLFTR